jgi:hypothetical protein
MGQTNDAMFWATSFIGTISIIGASFPAVDLMMDRKMEA